MIPSEKQMLRARMLTTLRAMTPADRVARSAEIGWHLAELRGVIFGFAPLALEPDWLPPGDGRKIVLPRIDGERLEFFSVGRGDELMRGPFGTREPRAGAAGRVAPGDADFVLVPGLAFDRAGGRLGRGGGFYDRFLADPAVRARRIGVAFACQLVGRVPTERHDERLDAVVTEDGWIEARSSGPGRD